MNVSDELYLSLEKLPEYEEQNKECSCVEQYSIFDNLQIVYMSCIGDLLFFIHHYLLWSCNDHVLRGTEHNDSLPAQAPVVTSDHCSGSGNVTYSSGSTLVYRNPFYPVPTPVSVIHCHQQFSKILPTPLCQESGVMSEKNRNPVHSFHRLRSNIN